MTMQNLKALENHLKDVPWQIEIPNFQWTGIRRIGYDRASGWNQGVFGECIRRLFKHLRPYLAHPPLDHPRDRLDQGK